MALPTLSKTWQLSQNQAVTAAGSANATGAKVARALKNLLIGFALNPWTVRGSSNAGGTTGAPTGAGAMDQVDRWTVDTDINTGGSNSRHAWIVLRQTGIATNYEICWDFNNTGTINAITFVISASAGFTGGSATARPTATDEIVAITTANWFSGVDAQHQINAWQSTDGQCTRVVIWRASTNLCTFWLFDKPQNPVSNWHNPSIGGAYAATSGISISYSLLSVNSSFVAYGASSFVPKLSGECDTAGLLANTTSVGTIVNDFDTNWPIFPIGIYSNTAGNRGTLGNVFDLWWRPSGAADGDTFPNDANNRQFVCFGPLILPWSSNSTAPLLT